MTERWGVKVTSVEIREIVPPKDIQDAMNRQMSAERNRRAMVIESEGKRASAILVAEGEKQSAILKAEGDRQAAILRAEGFALALEKIFGTAKTVDSKTMMLQYFDTLKQMGTGRRDEVHLPDGVHEHAEAAGQPRGGGGRRSRALSRGASWRSFMRCKSCGYVTEARKGRRGLPGVRGAPQDDGGLEGPRLGAAAADPVAGRAPVILHFSISFSASAFVLSLVALVLPGFYPDAG